MFVAVYLLASQKHTVVPTEFVMDLNQVSLNNYGVNPNQSQRIYFSKVLFDAYVKGEDTSHIDYAPNFNLPVSEIYPLPDGLSEACFYGRLKKFFGKSIKNNRVFFIVQRKQSHIL